MDVAQLIDTLRQQGLQREGPLDGQVAAARKVLDLLPEVIEALESQFKQIASLSDALGAKQALVANALARSDMQASENRQLKDSLLAARGELDKLRQSVFEIAANLNNTLGREG